jgi:hypothetical protein
VRNAPFKVTTSPLSRSIRPMRFPRRRLFCQPACASL